MRRRRDIAASPRRNAAQVWEVIGELVADSLARSSSIEHAAVLAALAPLNGLARMLISGGHLEENALTLVAGEIWLEIFTVSGGPALNLGENLNFVPGVAQASDWTLYVPQVEPLAKLVRGAVNGQGHLSAAEPSALQNSSSAVTAGTARSLVDLDAVAAWVKERP